MRFEGGTLAQRWCKLSEIAYYETPANPQICFVLACREDSRICAAFLTALNTFLLAHGLDVSSQAAELHNAVHVLLLRCWRYSRDQKLREAMTAYLRIQLTLGGITGKSRNDIGRALEGVLQQSGFKW